MKDQISGLQSVIIFLVDIVHSADSRSNASELCCPVDILLNCSCCYHYLCGLMLTGRLNSQAKTDPNDPITNHWSSSNM